MYNKNEVQKSEVLQKEFWQCKIVVKMKNKRNQKYAPKQNITIK